MYCFKLFIIAWRVKRVEKKVKKYRNTGTSNDSPTECTAFLRSLKHFAQLRKATNCTCYLFCTTSQKSKQWCNSITWYAAKRNHYKHFVVIALAMQLSKGLHTTGNKCTQAHLVMLLASIWLIFNVHRKTVCINRTYSTDLHSISFLPGC